MPALLILLALLFASMRPAQAGPVTAVVIAEFESYRLLPDPCKQELRGETRICITITQAFEVRYRLIRQLGGTRTMPMGLKFISGDHWGRAMYTYFPRALLVIEEGEEGPRLRRYASVGLLALQDGDWASCQGENPRRPRPLEALKPRADMSLWRIPAEEGYRIQLPSERDLPLSDCPSGLRLPAIYAGLQERYGSEMPALDPDALISK
ncbi:hypothetical protein [Massilia sp. TS11]|uniref:hypothetical protein n=1 Tax=Massilia sp. TS11 TaxID=2908003 RepID=UPI001EDA9B34|nr:hypothetical protein [Massilia sp. TS11]MCG2586578.1 hypothetical protein [Massilia sp. TS11]